MNATPHLYYPFIITTAITVMLWFVFLLLSGDYCESDMDGCQDNPCTQGTNCTDVTPAEQVTNDKSYTCSDCPEGTEDNEGICLCKYVLSTGFGAFIIM